MFNKYSENKAPSNMAKDAQWNSLLTRTRAKGKTLGIIGEADVERLSDEYRREKGDDSSR
jgi:hypothetical protein